MPAAVAIPLATGLGTAGGMLGAGAFQAHAAGNAAEAQAKSAAEALAFQKQQAEQDFMNAQANRRGNFDQWKAQQGRLSTLGQMVGLQPFNIPDYVPLQRVTTMADAMKNYNPPGSRRFIPGDNRQMVED